MKLGCHAVLFTDQIATDTDGLLARLREAGAEGVEIGARFFGIEKKDMLKASLERQGLRLSGLHVAQPLIGFLDAPERCGEALTQAARFLEGMPDRNIIMTGMLSPSAWNSPDLGDVRLTQSDSVLRIAEALNTISERIRVEHDVQLRYHNHSWEFKNDGLIALTLLESAPELRLALDTGWAAVSGFDPIALIRSHPGRFGYVHLRDFRREESLRCTTFEELQNGYVDLGTGDMDYRQLMAVLSEELGENGWAVVEYEKGEVDAVRYARALRHVRSMLPWMNKPIELTWTDRRQVLDTQEIEACMLEYASLPFEAAAASSAMKSPNDGRFAARIAPWLDSLGWMNLDKWADEAHLAAYLHKAREVREKADAFVVVGVGGSNQSARAAITALKPPGGPEILYAGNTLSAWETRQVLERLEGKSVYINVIAKNFETLEPGIAFRVLRTWMRERYGEAWAERVIVTGTAGSHLQDLCDRHGISFFAFPDDVGGRYTALTSVGLFPMAVAGLDIAAMVEGAREAQLQMKQASPLDNPALRYAAIRNLLYRKGYRMEMLSFFEPRWVRLSRWWTQLFAESEGKDDTGLYPITGCYSEDLHSIGQFVQEGTPILFETWLHARSSDASLTLAPDGLDDRFGYLDGMDLDTVNRTACEATQDAHADRLPCVRLEVPAMDARTFGSLFMFFQTACLLSGAMLGVNPFDQNGVEGYKRNLFRSLGKP